MALVAGETGGFFRGSRGDRTRPAINHPCSDARMEAGLRNVSFTQCDVSQISGGKSFDAAVGRFILMWLPDPISVLRSVSQKVRPGGVVAFQEPYWSPLLALVAPLSLWSATASLIHETFRRWGSTARTRARSLSIIPRSGVARTNDAIRDAANSAAISQYRIDVCYASERQRTAAHLRQYAGALQDPNEVGKW